MIMYHMKKCKITIDKIIFEIVSFETNTAKKIWEALPIISSSRIWGEEIYCYTEVNSGEGTRSKMCCRVR